MEIKYTTLYCDKHSIPLTFIKTEDKHNCFVCKKCNDERSQKS